mmetsp:Transcript_26756/g.100619  ORF Transcript_26756/g.100619 Transcript_26756/m.100619 type:complete len:320 (+) Transcript_26756:98-1057(+)
MSMAAAERLTAVAHSVGGGSGGCGFGGKRMAHRPPHSQDLLTKRLCQIFEFRKLCHSFEVCNDVRQRRSAQVGAGVMVGELEQSRCVVDVQEAGDARLAEPREPVLGSCVGCDKEVHGLLGPRGRCDAVGVQKLHQPAERFAVHVWDADDVRVRLPHGGRQHTAKPRGTSGKHEAVSSDPGSVHKRLQPDVGGASAEQICRNRTTSFVLLGQKKRREIRCKAAWRDCHAARSVAGFVAVPRQRDIPHACRQSFHLRHVRVSCRTGRVSRSHRQRRGCIASLVGTHQRPQALHNNTSGRAGRPAVAVQGGPHREGPQAVE